MAGTAGGPSDVSGTYWSGTRNDLFNAGRCSVSAVNASFDGYVSPATGCSVRCVRAREGQAVPCFFPLSGSAVGPSDVSGSYWTSTLGYPDNVQTFYYLALGATAGDVTGFINDPRPGFSVRCVRAREEQAVPFFWIWFWSSLNYEGLAGVRGIRSGCRRSVSGLFSNPPVAVMASGNASSVSPAAPVGNTVVLPAGILAVTFIFPVVREGCRAGGALRVLLDD